MDLADVVRRHGPAYLAAYGAQMLSSHRAALDAILRCHTPECGGSIYACDSCGERYFAYHRCGNRACGQCGHSQAEQWCERQSERLLPVGYFLLTFTVPESLRTLFSKSQRTLYDLLFKESAAAVQDIARDPRHLGGDVAMLGVLHTWTRQLTYHPHVHYLIPGVALCADGTLCFPKSPEFLLPVQRLSSRLRARLKSRLASEHPETYRQIPISVWRGPWVAHSQFAGRGKEALQYLSRYVQKTAISSARILSQDDQSVTFSYRESGTNERRTLRLRAHEFLRRFLQHVLPKGFRRVRTYGWASPAAQGRLALVVAMLAAPPPTPRTRQAFTITIACPRCEKPMRRVGEIERAPPPPPSC